MEIRTEKGASRSHIAHEKHIKSLINEKENRLFLLRNNDCVAYKLSIQSLEILKPFFDTQNTWLTIGDYTGFEAKYFKEHNQSAVASDISDTFLKEAKLEGYIDHYRKENVEYINLDEDSFDYVSCREAFHHFPRAYLGIYEMIRVSKKASILIEPIDILLKMPIILFLKNICDIFSPHLINKIWKNRFSWEPVGNYVFKISEREIEKIAMGIGLPCIAFKDINIIINIKQDITEVPTNYKLLKKINRKLKLLNFLCKLRIIPFNRFCSVLFKETPDEETLLKLRKEGYKIIHLPANPYLKPTPAE